MEVLGFNRVAAGFGLSVMRIAITNPHNFKKVNNMTKEKMEYKEHTRKEIEISKEALEPIMAKAERIANSIIRLNSYVPNPQIKSIQPANKFIVCLLENGKLAPSIEPKQHNTRESADKEAERLCKLYHQEFVVLQVVTAIKPQEPKKEVFA